MPIFYRILVDNGLKGLGEDRLDLSGLILPKQDISVTKNFDHTKEIGVATNLEIKGDSLFADIIIDSANSVLYPAVGGIVSERSGDAITKFKLASVSLCTSRNKDENIKTILEQLTNRSQDTI